MSTADLLPFERVQIDHTRIDVIVVDEGDRLPIGRPWLTLAIDVASRAALGFSFSLEGPSVVSVALTLVHSGSAKRPVARRSTIRGALANVGSPRTSAPRQCGRIPLPGGGSWRSRGRHPD